MARLEGMQQGSNCDHRGDPIDTGPLTERIGSLERVPLLRPSLAICGVDMPVIREAMAKARLLGGDGTDSELLAAVCRFYLEAT